MTYLKMDGVKLKPFAMMEPLEDETDVILDGIVAPLQDDEGAQ